MLNTTDKIIKHKTGLLNLAEEPGKAALSPILDEAENAIQEDGIGALVLGCAGMVRVTTSLRAALPVPVIDPVEAAAGSIAWLNELRH